MPATGYFETVMGSTPQRSNPLENHAIASVHLPGVSERWVKLVLPWLAFQPETGMRKNLKCNECVIPHPARACHPTLQPLLSYAASFLRVLPVPCDSFYDDHKSNDATRDRRFQRTTPALNFEANCGKSKPAFSKKSQIDITFPNNGKYLVTMKYDLNMLG